MSHDADIDDDNDSDKIDDSITPIKKNGRRIGKIKVVRKQMNSKSTKSVKVELEQELPATPLTSLLRRSSRSDQSEAKLIRQRDLLNKITASSDQYDKLLERYDEAKLKKLIKDLDNFKYGINAVAPCVCLGPDKCAFYHACPIGMGYSYNKINGSRTPLYDSIDDFPIGDQCIVEKVYVEQKLIDYIQEFDVDPARPSELALINDLALCDLHKNRAVLVMAGGDREGEGIDFMKVDTSTSVGAVSTESRAYKEHPIFGIIEKLEKRRHKILEELLATRKVRAVTAARFGTGIQTSQLMTEIERLRKAIEMKKSVGVLGDGEAGYPGLDDKNDMIPEFDDIEDDMLELE